MTRHSDASDTFSPAQEFPYERHGVSVAPNGDRTPVVYRYQTAEDRENHMREEERTIYPRRFTP